MRNTTFDVIRGLAIVLMILANAAPLYPDQFPFAMRLVFSFPAPMFILISGLMLALGSNRHPFSYFFKRALFIIGLAVLIDIAVHQKIPFHGFDILYLIGFSMPIVVLALRLNSYGLFFVVTAIFLVSELARWHFGYTPMPHEPLSVHSVTSYLYNPSIKPWLLDGDFPLLPWTGVMLFGGLIGKLYVASKDANYFQSKRFISMVIGTIFVGVLLVVCSPRPAFSVANGYAELFYPAHAGVVICLASFTLILLALSKYIHHIRFLAELGRSSLAIYAFHLILIELAAGIFGYLSSLAAYFLLFICLFALVYCFSHLLVQFKNQHPKLPTLVAWLVGT